MQKKHPSIEALGAAIRARREATGVSQEAFAAKAGVDRSYYGYIERGSHAPSIMVLLRIAHALGTDAGELMRIAQDVYPPE